MIYSNMYPYSNLLRIWIRYYSHYLNFSFFFFLLSFSFTPSSYNLALIRDVSIITDHLGLAQLNSSQVRQDESFASTDDFNVQLKRRNRRAIKDYINMASFIGVFDHFCSLICLFWLHFASYKVYDSGYFFHCLTIVLNCKERVNLNMLYIGTGQDFFFIFFIKI